jgi:RecA/RadA recombinase
MEPELRNTINNERLDRYIGIYKDTFNENYNNLEKVTVIRHEISNYIKETQFRYLDNKFKILKLLS